MQEIEAISGILSRLGMPVRTIDALASENHRYLIDAAISPVTLDRMRARLANRISGRKSIEVVPINQDEIWD